MINTVYPLCGSNSTKMSNSLYMTKINDNNLTFDISKLPPKEQIAAQLVSANPNISKREIGRIFKDLGLYKHERSALHLVSIDQAKQALKQYAHNNIIPKAYRIHKDKLDHIATKEPEDIKPQDAQWVFQGEKLAGEDINIQVEETVKVGVIHAMLDDLLPPKDCKS